MARPDLIKRGYTPKTVRLHEVSAEKIQARCQQLQYEMLDWAGEQRLTRSAYDGTLQSLIDWYQSDPISPYSKLRPSTLQSYSQVLKKLSQAKGALLVEDITGVTVLKWFNELSKQTSVSYAGLMVRIFKVVIAFGSSNRLPECTQLRAELRDARFEGAAPRKSYMTHAQVEAFCEKAVELERPSMALGVLLQFELAFRQRDVIGEWYGGEWRNGLSWSHIDANGVLRKVTTKTGAEAVHHLSDHPGLCVFLDLVFANRHRIGPLVVAETTGQPYSAFMYRVQFRLIARAAGLPDSLWNMDARAGAVTEAFQGGAAEKDVMAMSTHASAQINRRYDRSNEEKTRRAVQARLTMRKQP